MQAVRPEPGSFRDPDSRVVYRDGEVLRTLSAQGLADWRRLSASALFPAFVGAGKLVPVSYTHLTLPTTPYV